MLLCCLPFFRVLCKGITFDFLLSDQNTTAFKEVAIIRHPRIGEYAFGFITSSVTLQVSYSATKMVKPK